MIPFPLDSLWGHTLTPLKRLKNQFLKVSPPCVLRLHGVLCTFRVIHFAELNHNDSEKWTHDAGQFDRLSGRLLHSSTRSLGVPAIAGRTLSTRACCLFARQKHNSVSCPHSAIHQRTAHRRQGIALILRQAEPNMKRLRPELTQKKALHPFHLWYSKLSDSSSFMLFISFHRPLDSTSIQTGKWIGGGLMDCGMGSFSLYTVHICSTYIFILLHKKAFCYT